MSPIDIMPGVEGKPLFATEEEYQAWRQSYMDEVAPLLAEWTRKRKECNF